MNKKHYTKGAITLTDLNKLQEKAEKISVKNEYSINLMESIKEDFLDLADFSNTKKITKELTFYELQRVARRAEVMFNLLGKLMIESDNLNNELTSELVEMASKGK